MRCFQEFAHSSIKSLVLALFFHIAPANFLYFDFDVFLEDLLHDFIKLERLAWFMGFYNSEELFLLRMLHYKQ